MKCICHKCKGEVKFKHTDREYLRWMIKHRIIHDEEHGGDWRELGEFPVDWDSEVVRTILDVAMRRK